MWIQTSSEHDIGLSEKFQHRSSHNSFKKTLLGGRYIYLFSKSISCKEVCKLFGLVPHTTLHTFKYLYDWKLSEIVGMQNVNKMIYEPIFCRYK